MADTKRQTIYLRPDLRDYLVGYESQSGRINDIVDRYHEALRRTRIERHFTADEQAHIKRACSSWRMEPAATIFGGIELELDDEGIAPQELISKIAALSPFEQVALAEWVESERDLLNDE